MANVRGFFCGRIADPVGGPAAAGTGVRGSRPRRQVRRGRGAAPVTAIGVFSSLGVGVSRPGTRPRRRNGSVAGCCIGKVGGWRADRKQAITTVSSSPCGPGAITRPGGGRSYQLGDAGLAAPAVDSACRRIPPCWRPPMLCAPLQFWSPGPTTTPGVQHPAQRLPRLSQQGRTVRPQYPPVLAAPCATGSRLARKSRAALSAGASRSEW